jgi:F-type H+-transporting ATPase subunit gamma
MAQNLRDIRNRIRGIRNIGQVTRAMDMVASARLRRAQMRAQAARPYARRIQEILQEVATAAPGFNQHPLLRTRNVHTSCVVVFTSDKGLCGGFNSNVLDKAEKLANSLDAPEHRFVVIGRKGVLHFRAEGVHVDKTFPGPGKEPNVQEIGDITRFLISSYLNQTYDEIHLVFTSFLSAMRSEPVSLKLIPLGSLEQAAAREEDGEKGREESSESRKQIDFIFEPSVEQLADYLLPLYVEVLINRALLDSSASEHAARMVAMRNATENSEELIKQLSKTYNRVRQGSITKEILEVVSGAEAFQHH